MMNDYAIEKLLDLQYKSAKLDAIVEYVRTTPYSPDKDVILAMYNGSPTKTEEGKE